MQQRRVLLSATGPHGNVLKIRPPLSFIAANSDRFLDALTQVVSELRCTLAGRVVYALEVRGVRIARESEWSTTRGPVGRVKGGITIGETLFSFM